MPGLLFGIVSDVEENSRLIYFPEGEQQTVNQKVRGGIPRNAELGKHDR